MSWILNDNGERFTQWLDRDETIAHDQKSSFYPQQILMTINRMSMEKIHYSFLRTGERTLYYCQKIIWFL